MRKRPKLWLKFFNMLAISEGKYRWVHKKPRNVYRIDKLLEISPDAKILLIIRDGRDVACSLQDRKGDIESGIKRWVLDNRAGEKYWKYQSVHILKYEQLVEDFDGTITKVLNFLDEAYEPEIREFHKKPKLLSGASKQHLSVPAEQEQHAKFRNWQVNQPLFDGRGKWKRMTEEEKRVVKECAGDMLVEYGYVENNDW